MFRRFINWLTGDTDTRNASTPEQRRRISAHNAIMPKPARATRSPQPQRVFDPYLPSDGAIESGGPGKNVLIRNKYVREDTGTHETLRIMDDSMVDSGDENGVDPYNSGEFDRSKNWDVRFRS
jgi:hypothetical protein